MLSPSVKRSRLAQVAGSKVVSQSALSSILEKFTRTPAPEQAQGTSRRSVGRALEAEISRSTFHGSLFTKVALPLENGSVFWWDIVDPLPLLNWLCDQSPTFAEVLFYLLERHPCSVANPWSIVAYVDEAVPGNMLNLDHTRKAHCWYWSFGEFGPELLCREEIGL